MSREEEQGLFAMSTREAMALQEAFSNVLCDLDDAADLALLDRLQTWISRRREGPVSLHGD